MGKVGAFLLKELREIIPATIFFLILFHLVALTRSLMLAQYQITVASATAATIGALIVAKVILIADKLPITNVFADRPLVYNVLWRTFVYGACALLIQYLEEFIPALSATGSLAAANQKLVEEIVWAHFWAVHVWILFGLLVYCTVSELIKAIGPDRAREILLGPRKIAGRSA